jgi:predicted O-methyltransferase YrrM
MNKLSELVRLIEFNPKSLQTPNAWVGHMPFAYWLIEKLKPSTFVELGTHTGNSYFSFCQSIQENKIKTKAFAVDTWQGDAHAGSYNESIFDVVNRTNLDYISFSTLLRTTFDSALEKFEDGSIDLLHIDGLHTYEAVKHDFETWLPKMSSRGVVLFHDTNVRRDDFGVYQLWSEISSKYNSLEFFHSNGLGILELSKGSNMVIPAEEEKQRQLRDIFALLSEQLLIRFERDSLLTERDSLLNSGSWKITSGLRALWGFFHRKS